MVYSELADSKVDPVMEKPWQRKRRIELYEYYRKSKLPPLRIEPMWHDRQRLANGGMTDEDRALRRQWLRDQELKYPKREIPELQPKNIFKRIWRAPWDLLIGKPANKYLDPFYAKWTRWSAPKVIMFVPFLWAGWYWLKYHGNDWQKTGGPWYYFEKPMLVGYGSEEVEKYVKKEEDDFVDFGYKDRKVYKDITKHTFSSAP